jgi:hypothetical protein
MAGAIMKINLSKLEIILLITGVLLAFAGYQLRIPLLITLGLGLIPLVMILSGVEDIINRQAKWGITTHYSETYRGLAAIALGIIFVIAGMGIGAMVVAQAINREESLFGLIFSRPGYIILIIAAVAFLRGLAGVIGAVEWQESTSARISGFIERIAMSILAFLGLIGLGLGSLEIILPDVFRQLISVVWHSFLYLIGFKS